jgi:hypothetical protein
VGGRRCRSGVNAGGRLWLRFELVRHDLDLGRVVVGQQLGGHPACQTLMAG